MLAVWQRYPQDAYYTAKYHVNDNNAIMRLQAWGANLEILLPTALRDRGSDIPYICPYSPRIV